MTVLTPYEQDTITHPSQLSRDYSRTVIVDYGYVQTILPRLPIRLFTVRNLVLNLCTHRGDNDRYPHLIIDAHYAPDSIADNAEVNWKLLPKMVMDRAPEIGDIRFEIEYHGKETIDCAVGDPGGLVIKVAIFTSGYFADCRDDDHYWSEILHELAPDLKTENLACLSGERFDLARSLARGDVSVDTNDDYDGSNALNDIVLLMERDEYGKPMPPRGFHVPRAFNASWDMPDRELD